MKRHANNPASAGQQPEPSTGKVEQGSSPALIALVRLLARQVAAELISAASPENEPGSLTNPSTCPPDEVLFVAPKENSR